MEKHNNIAGRHFNRKTLNALSRKGITLIGSTWAPGADGSFANGQTIYALNDNGTQRMRSYLEVLAVAS